MKKEGEKKKEKAIYLEFWPGFCASKANEETRVERESGKQMKPNQMVCFAFWLSRRKFGTRVQGK